MLHTIALFSLCILFIRQSSKTLTFFSQCLQDGPNCQPETKSTPIPVGEQSDTPDPLLDDAPEAAGGALSTWGLWNLLNNPNTPLPH